MSIRKPFENKNKSAAMEKQEAIFFSTFAVIFAYTENLSNLVHLL